MASTTLASGSNSSSAAFVTTDTDHLAKLVLRVLVGVLVLFHGVSKLVAGPGFIVGVLANHGLPSFLAYGVYLGEVVAPILLIIGLFTRPAALVVVINMIVALALVHANQFFGVGPQGGYALELQAFFLFTALAVAMQGAGRYSVGGVNGRWN